METSTMKQLVENAIQCSICTRPMNLMIIYRCVQCDNGILYCEECGQFFHRQQRRNHEFSGQNIKHVEHINEIQLQSDQEQGKKQLYHFITQYYMKTDQDRIKFLNATLNFVVAIKAGEGAAKAIAVNALDLVVDIGHGIKNLSTNATHMASSVANVGSAIAPVATSAGIAAGIVTALELCYVTYKFYNGDIPDWATYGRLVTRSIATGAGAFIGNCAGYISGAMVGGAIGMIGGPGGAAIGALIGSIVGGIFGSIAGGATAAQAFNKFWPDNEQTARTRLVREALMQYGYSEGDIKNAAVFNEKMIKAKYKQLSLVYHPDRETGSTQAFQQLSINHGIIWSLLTGSKHEKDGAIKAMIEAGV